MQCAEWLSLSFELQNGRVYEWRPQCGEWQNLIVHGTGGRVVESVVRGAGCKVLCAQSYVQSGRVYSAACKEHNLGFNYGVK